LTLSQGGYIKSILELFGMSACQPARVPIVPGLDLPRLASTPPDAARFPYRQAIGKLLYLSLCTRPDITFAVNYLSRFSGGFDHRHWNAVLQVLRYLKATPHMGIHYQRGPLILEGYSDADWGGDTHDRVSVTGYLFKLCGGPISWATKKQSTTALSSTEAEYLATTDTGKQALHLRHLLHQITGDPQQPIVLWVDNQGAIALSHDPVHHARTKHFDIRHHWIREQVECKLIQLQYCPTESMTADMLTKALVNTKFEKFRNSAGIF
jgi:hypothetical protein